MPEPTPKSVTASVANWLSATSKGASNSSSKAKAGTKTSAKERQQQFAKQTHVSGNKLFCSSCNIVLDHTRKSSVTQHLTSTKHQNKERTLDSDESTPKRQKVMSQFQATVPGTVSSRGKKHLYDLRYESFKLSLQINS